MAEIELTRVQRRILSALVSEHEGGGATVTGATLADVVDLHEGTVRNQMGNLTSLGLVESVRGPKGGYRPTADARSLLGRDDLQDATDVTLSRDFERVSVTVDEIDLFNVHNPDSCKARLHFQDPVRDYGAGDAIAIGPTPVSGLLLAGVVEAVDPATDEIVVSRVTLETPQA